MAYLSLSRAARLAGVTRGELQARIRRGEISTFEGAVPIEDLLRTFPSISLDDDSALERVERIKADATPRLGVTDAALPEPRILLSRLRGLSDGLASRIAALDAAEALLEQVGERLTQLASLTSDRQAAAVQEAAEWFANRRRDLSIEAAPTGQARLLAADAFLRVLAANVRLIPSGHEFLVEGRETILDASVRAGLKLSYGCSSGNCGNCKARLVSGESRKVRDHDYVISDREKAMGYLLTCSHTAITDLVIEAAEAASAADLPHQEIRATLRKRESISPELILINLQTPRTQTLRFMAGQRARLALDDGASRELPIASCPCNGRSLWFLVRRQDDAFSEALFKPLRPGNTVTVDGPHGAFVLAEEATEASVFIAFGDGIAPIKSLIEHAVSIDTIESYRLYWGTNYAEGHHQSHWGRALTDALDNFRFIPLENERPEAMLAAVRSDHPDLSSRRVYLAGPRPAVEAVAAALRESGVDHDKIAVEETAT